jgi:hypothetical protein
MNSSFLQHRVEVRQGAYLPHWTAEGSVYHVVFRLVDSLPQAQLLALRESLRLAELNAPPGSNRGEQIGTDEVESLLDEGAGACWLRTPAVASMVAGALVHFEGARYVLFAWCIMPNHVHAVVRPTAPYQLKDILHSWKSFTSSQANRLLQRAGAFWQKESFDHIVRDEGELAVTIKYVQQNPVKAGLGDWVWVYPK